MSLEQFTVKENKIKPYKFPDLVIEKHDEFYIVRDDLLEGGSKRRFIDRLIRESIETILLISLIISVFHISLQNFQVEGSSMDPNIKEGNCVVAEKVTYWKKPELFSNYLHDNYIFDQPNRGEVVIFKFPNDPTRFFVKRIILIMIFCNFPFLFILPIFELIFAIRLYSV